MGRHLLYVLQSPQASDLTRDLKIQYAIELTRTICIYLVKLSIILLLARLFAGTSVPYLRLWFHVVHTFLSL